ncbi:quinol dehydrogenase ferredoxin subunit NapH [Indioceanicola profundi]|uniref:quinol dehydrogenase ferredoxin subunit NapH n=1 Tax=Indioceanicola profundi TaxID=2220096 RepID=UPI000E6AD373|nr:quinol dehydrogenase ferredoxin subunit NapH [Indioceanicola profundi]
MKLIDLAGEPRRGAIRSKGWLKAHKYWLLRRTSQISLLLLFAIGPWLGLWFVQGNFASSRVLDSVPLSDPFILLQSAMAGHVMATAALIGALVVVLFYAFVGGRVYCSWVCPVNIVTDTAHWLREQLGITRDRKLNRNARLTILAAALGASMVTGTIAWELVNPVSVLQRGIIFGIGFGWALIAAIFLLDLCITRRGWCGHLCPVGAFYGLLGAKSVIRISARGRQGCENCGACLRACPEPHVIAPALKGNVPLVLSRDCTTCGGCIDACPSDVFSLATRFQIANHEGGCNGETKMHRQVSGDTALIQPK